MPKPIRLGILTPSSNTSLEPLTQAIITSVNAHLPTTSPKITVHFSRFPVTTISLRQAAITQFNLAPILAAADLLAHAEVDIIGWSGTSSGWLGFDKDEELCREIEKSTGIKCTTSVLALNKALEMWGSKTLGLITPYMDDVQEAIVKNYKGIGIEIGQRMERHLGLEKNTAFGAITEQTLDEMVEDVATKSRPDAITTFCTNLTAAQRVAFWEEEYDIPVFDTVTTVVWDMLRMCNVQVATMRGWGMIFEKQ